LDGGHSSINRIDKLHVGGNRLRGAQPITKVGKFDRGSQGEQYEEKKHTGGSTCDSLREVHRTKELRILPLGYHIQLRSGERCDTCRQQHLRSAGASPRSTLASY
jgi:hypothetical protein